MAEFVHGFEFVEIQMLVAENMLVCVERADMGGNNRLAIVSTDIHIVHHNVLCTVPIGGRCAGLNTLRGVPSIDNNCRAQYKVQGIISIQGLSR